MNQQTYADLVAILDQDLIEMQRSLGARSVFVIDDSGQILTTHPPGSELDAAVLGALAAANLAATQQIAHLVEGENSGAPRLLLIETRSGGILLCGAPNRLSLVVVLDPESPLGLARLEAQEMVERLAKLGEPSGEQSGEQPEPSATGDLTPFTDESGLMVDIMDQIDELFG